MAGELVDGSVEASARELLFDPAEVGVPTTAAIRWLIDNGVGIETIGDFHATEGRWAVGAAHICIQPSGRYLPVSVGDFAFVFACVSTGGVIDLAAWQP